MVRFIPANELKDKYGVFGHFYSVEVAPNKVVIAEAFWKSSRNPVLPRESRCFPAESPMLYSS